MNIELDMQYRDGGNWKTDGSVILTNKHNLSVAYINEVLFKHNFNRESFMAQYYGLPSVAALDNEFAVANNEEDHSFMELCGINETNESANQGEDAEVRDIQDFLDFVTNPQEVKKRQAADWNEAREEALRHLDQLNAVNPFTEPGLH